MDAPLHNKANEEASAQTLVRLSIAVHHSQQDKLPIQEEEESIWEVVAWHEVEAVPLLDPVSRKKTLLLLQADISLRVERELKLAALTEAQLSMLEQMFPRHVIEYMIGNPDGLKVRRGDMDLENPAESSSISNNNLATWHQGVTIMFMDIVGFTAMSKEVHPSQVMAFLNALFTLFDELIDQYNVYKVETAGDCYIVAGALMSQDDEGFLVLEQAGDPRQRSQTRSQTSHGFCQVMAFAKAILRCAKTVTMPHNGKPTVVRVGMHTGPVVTGLIGTKLPKFSIFGDTMNTASRMESTSQPGCIHVTEDTHNLLTPYTFKPTGGVDVKGKGLMNTF
ncbi:hypothetical protein CEUSTIGMA_g6136.t1 [Chlamydomonas eustigma]|uniref:Guanylate cyclase domain-containing protein n=1 Tax=Chlamydomonas eustigma TaxID=1157962 RepID=A0A250X6J4_9CHLO|nr:hypothetical protein CEUSTIGMA_g6136.t1 [Chlamydomonas eustigma]|eukprot:GAX78698.1 hypothetical protein CEUSTIGMA_g6136.t1 [Chlamydomonas eustigma]